MFNQECETCRKRSTKMTKKRARKSNDVDVDASQESKRQKTLQTDLHLLQCPQLIVKEPLHNLYMDVNTYPRAMYYSRKDCFKSTLHWGQRKLFLSEMFILLEYLRTSAKREEHLVLYAGAAPGTHITYLSELFPMFRFVLVDPAQFKVTETERITVRNEYFTDTTADEWREKVDLFFCDIRTANWRIMNSEENEQAVVKDMAAQQKWTRVIKPKLAMLKFRLPYMDGETEYLNGKVLFPIFAPQTTTETRLIISDTNYQTRVYDHRSYWEQLFYFNTVDRVCYYLHDIDAHGLDHCFDCAAEVFILRQYLKLMNTTESEMSQQIAKLSEHISTRISPSGRTLADFPSQANVFHPVAHRQDVSSGD